MKKIFLTFIFLLGLTLLAQAAGMQQLEGSFKLWPAIILITVLATFVIVGLRFKAKDTTDYWAAGRNVSVIGNGMAIGSNWMSAASFLGMAGMMYGYGYDGLAYVVGWTGGYVLLMLLMAGPIRKYGKYTAADFIGDRYYSQGLRLFGAIIAIFISFTYCVGQFAGIGLMFKWILGINYMWSVIIGSSVVLFYTLISGMIGATKNMQIQYVILIIAFLIPTFILTFQYDYFFLLPQFGYGQVVSDIVQGIPAPHLSDGIVLTNVYANSYSIVPSPEFAMPWDTASGKTFFEWMTVCFSLMVGTAGLPHVLQRFYIVPRVKDARYSVIWGLFFICILYWSAPIYSAFGQILSAHPEVGFLASDAIVVYTAQLASINKVIVGFLAAGAISAAFSTVSGLFVAGGSAFAHDIYVKIYNPQASPKRQLLVARLGIILMAIVVTIVALMKLGLIAQLVAVSFALAACTIFPLFLMGIWWSGANRQGAIAGLSAGGLVAAVALTYFIAGKSGVTLPGHTFFSYYLNAWNFAWIGTPLAILMNFVVSKLTTPTPLEIRKFLAEQVHSKE